MAEKNLSNIRIINKHDTEANWIKATGFVPKQGELIVYDIDNNYNYERIKIGDGVKNVDALPFYTTSWNDITDRPTVIFGGDTLTWDGNGEGFEVFNTGRRVSYIVSDVVITYDDIKNGCMFTISNGETYEYGPEIVKQTWETFGLLYDYYFFIIPYDNFFFPDFNLTFPKAGVYFLKDGEDYIASLTIRGYTGFQRTEKLDEKYLPESIAAIPNEIDELKELVGDTAVSEQIATAQIVYVGPNMPTDSNIKVWINTAEEGSGVIPVLPRVSTVTLNRANWTGSAAPYSQIVDINTVTTATKVELNPTVSQIVSLQNDDVALMADNDGGVVTIYSFGGKPSTDMAMQVTLTEVSYV